MDLKNYRIKKITKGNGEVWYEPQIRYSWFFWTSFADCYGNERWAQEVILEDYQKNQQKVEYLPVDTSKIAHQTPNPPPRVV